MANIGELSELQEEKKSEGFFKYMFNFDFIYIVPMIFN